MLPLAAKQLHAFHAKDREIFCKLVLLFSRPPAESLLVMATWFWLEDFGFEDIFSTILALEDPFIAILAKEAVLCYRCLGNDDPPSGDPNQIPITAKITRNDLSLQFIYRNKYTAIVGIRNFLNTVCSRVFTDILQQVLPSSSTPFRRPLVIPGFPDPIFGNINVVPDFVDRDNLSSSNILFPNDLWSWNATCIATQNERTLFVTFSRGYPVTKAEVKQVFTDAYGENCVEDVFMPTYHVSSPNKNAYINGQYQSLWARAVMESVVIVDRVLDGNKVKKFQINGKHMWARKFNERNDAHN